MRQQEEAICIISSSNSLDTKEDSNSVAPSYRAISALNRARWVILTNGRIWRLYSNRVSSKSTDYFEIDLDGISGAEDPRLQYFVALFSAHSLFPQREGEVSDLDSIYEEGIRYAKKIEDDLRNKIFEGKLFLNLVKAVLSHSLGKEYLQSELDNAKSTALRLLYRLLFVLYAESRDLLPVHDSRYRPISLDSIRRQLEEYSKKPDESDVWERLLFLFDSIENGNVEAQVPEYDGELFRHDNELDNLKLKNKFLVPAIQELTEWEGGGIDYQNLGVRHLGSLYEGLLEYDVKQAKADLVVYKDGELDASYAADLKQKPRPFVEKGDLFLASKGLARKGTGSYYTPEEIVKFLTEEGLKPILEERNKRFEEHIKQFKEARRRDPELEQATIDDLLGIKVLDPAMGSGHFLVSAVNHITSWVIERLHEHPEAPLTQIIDSEIQSILENQRKKGIEIDTKLLTDTIILKRLVMKRCVYGVDINPLAVELAKLSLWLDSFTIGVPLTYLDNHIRCGDSLIGLGFKDIQKLAPNETLDRWNESLSANRDTLENLVSSPPDLTKEEVIQSKSNYESYRKNSEPQRRVLDTLCAELLDDSFSKKLLKDVLLVERALREENRKPEWWNEVERAVSVARNYGAFHWELEFPEAFQEGEPQFDLILTNPPWDDVEPEDDEFFSSYYSKFRRIRNKQEKKKIMQKLLTDREIAEHFQRYCLAISQRVNFYKKSGQFTKRGSGHTNLWKLFLERAFQLCSPKGMISIVVPSGIVTDEGAKQLREELFKGAIRAMYEFENREGIFPDVDGRYKFVLLVASRAFHAKEFDAAFYLHKVQSLGDEAESQKFVRISLELIQKCAPESLSIPEVRNKESLEIFSKIYSKHPLLGDDKRKSWTISLLRELNRTNDSDLYKRNIKGWPLIEGKNFHQFIPDYEKSEFQVDPEKGLERTAKHRQYHRINDAIHKTIRLGFRSVASSTNCRSMIACILPPKSFSPHNVTLVLPSIGKRIDPTSKDYSKLLSYLAGIFNSFVFDYLIRTRVSMHLSFFYVYQTPVPSDFGNELGSDIVRLSGILSSPDHRFEDFASSIAVKVSRLTMIDRIEITAQLNALVAKHYGLIRKELQAILDSFEGFKEDESIRKIEGEIKWDDDLIRKFNGEVRKRVMHYFDNL
jgi:hypothetical protein